MIYTRQKIDAGAFSDMLPDGASLSMIPELPKIEFKKGKIKYSITDIRLLNENAVHVFEMVLNACAEQPETSEVRFAINEETNDQTIDIITDILLGIGYAAKKGGKNGFEICGTFLTTATTREIDENGQMVFVVHVAKSHAKAIYDYVSKKPGDEKIGFLDLVVAVAENNYKGFAEWMEDKA